jgi:hypothetical protein
MSWHLDGRTLAWIDSSWTLKFRDLRSSTNGPVAPDIITEISLSTPLAPIIDGSRSISIESLQQLQTGDVILCLQKEV